MSFLEVSANIREYVKYFGPLQYPIHGQYFSHFHFEVNHQILWNWLHLSMYIVFGQWWIELWQSIIIEKFWFCKRKQNLANWPYKNYVDAMFLFGSRKPLWTEIIETLIFWVKVNLIGLINHSCEYLKQNNWCRASWRTLYKKYFLYTHFQVSKNEKNIG